MVDASFAAEVAAFLHRHGPTAAARMLGVTPRTVERWADGSRCPRGEERLRAAAVLAAATKPAPVVAPPVAVAASSSPDDDDETAQAIARRTVRILTSQLARLDVDPNATPRERAAVASALTGAVRLLARLEDEESLVRRFLKTQEWKTIEETLIAAIGRFGPAALLACSEALEQARAVRAAGVKR